MTDKITEFAIKPEAQANWEKGLANNTDPYGRRCFTYAADWAALMEQQMAKGKKLEDIAEATSQKADTDGITGFMYGMAVSILRDVWKHGADLNRWHNGQYGVKDPDAKGTVNPAVITIGE
jgi:hypothetical protein